MTRGVLQIRLEKMKGSFAELLKNTFARLKGSVGENETQADLEMNFQIHGRFS